MSYHDKISEWLAGHRSSNTRDADGSEDQQAVIDQEKLWEDDMNHLDVEELPELSEFRQTFTQSFSYRWLISRLQTRRELAVPAGQPKARSLIS